MKRIGWLLALAVALGGCLSPSGAPKWDTLTYSRTGGIAGFDSQLTVSADGVYQVVDRGRHVASGKLSGAELKALRERVAAVKWGELAPKYVDPRVADAIFEGVSIQLETRGYTTMVSTGGTPPGELVQVLEVLRQILADHGR